MKRGKRLSWMLPFLLGILLAFGSGAAVLAAGGDGSGGGTGGGNGSGQGATTETTTETTTTTPGSGGGTGGGSDEPLMLVSASPAADAVDVAVDAVITLEFSKNVAYATVREANLKAVTLWNGNTQVPAQIAMADDQLQPDLRNFITITPDQALKEGTTYTVKVDTTLSAKSGAVLTQPLEISFRTTAPPAAKVNSTLWIGLGALAVVIVIAAVVVIRRKKA
jgi:hypothetical protein